MTSKLSALGLAAALLFAVNSAQALETEGNSTPTVEQKTTTVKFANPFDPSTWYDAGGDMKPGHTEKINFADPAFWTKIVNPRTHSNMHMAFTNPATYSQFMRPQFFMQMMDPKLWMKWANPNSYKVFMDPATYAYWMQPGAYMHGMDTTRYMQIVNSENFTKLLNGVKPEEWIDLASYNLPGTTAEEGNATFFNPVAWMNMFSTAVSSTFTKTEKAG